MTESAYIPERVVELMSLPLGQFTEVTKDISPRPCDPGSEPGLFLRIEPTLANIPTKQLLPRLLREYRSGRQIFNSWLQLALEKWAAESPDEANAWTKLMYDGQHP
ncbi:MULTISPECIES: hypothetical protein [unclassified Leptolyngbya]|uniref:hypothetical protein n=1 Tax=unclassified Leptolyngbya TaxID=2650499 RepID=UPI001687D64B|nr:MULTISPECIES: hypothetical protein [unclassified Leptolyngbya]MBD1909215.1 hypothetical protein [Leptolyngbya sp. FACHB-8]MBD2153982.1 hypothetical protein [Leptolyngbya sp. FACHB-16]